MAGVPQIQNVVATMSVGVSLWLPDVARKLRVAEYNPARFSAVTFRIRRPRTTALLFSSGKVVCTGAKSRLEAILACYKYARCLRKYVGVAATVCDLQVQNIVSTVNVNMHLDLDKFSTNNHLKCNYDKNLFPGAIWRNDIRFQRMVVLVFQSGRMVITGAKREEETHEAFAQILPLVAACAVDRHASDGNDDQPVILNPRVRELIDNLISDSIADENE